MTFLQPAFLWGLLAVAIPVIIHLWHQKRGQPLPWAAMQWLREASEQQQRGLQFDDWLLLAIRCLVIALLSLLLAQPVWNDPNDPKNIRPVHLVVADSLVTRSFRFELEQAEKRAETVVRLPTLGSVNPLRLQATIDSLRGPGVLLHLYVRNDASLADVPQISVPQRFSLHTTMVPIPSRDEQALTQRFAQLKKPLNVRLSYRNPAEQKTVLAALRALTAVYTLQLTILDDRNSNTQPDWVLTDQPPTQEPHKSTLYVVSGAGMPPQIVQNVVFTADTLTPQTSELVANGQLPEWLGGQLLAFYKLNPPQPALSGQELIDVFVQTKDETTGETERSRTTEQNWLLMALLLVVGAERWLALRKK